VGSLLSGNAEVRGETVYSEALASLQIGNLSLMHATGPGMRRLFFVFFLYGARNQVMGNEVQH